MTKPYLEVTFRKGKPLAAYLHVSAAGTAEASRTRRFAPGLVADISSDGTLLGVEITAPSYITVSALNRALRALGARPVTEHDIAPLSAA